MTTLINLTPHDVHIKVRGEVGGDATALHTFPRSGKVARCVQRRELFDAIFPLDVDTPYMPVIECCQVNTECEVTDLPEPVEGVVYIVSLLVRLAVPTRRDLCSPGEEIRDEDGQIIGCKNLDFNCFSGLINANAG